MKKAILTLTAIFAFTMSASAVSFTWASSTAIKFDGSNLKSVSTVTGYLIYLGSGAYDTSYTLSETSTGDAVSSDIGTVIANKSGTSAMSKISSAATFDYGTYDNGDVFGMLLVYSNEGKTYFNLSSDTYTMSGLSDELSTPTAASFTFNYGGPTESTKVSSGGGWTVAVPEPSTAALALAGLALLIKRRRA